MKKAIVAIFNIGHATHGNLEPLLLPPLLTAYSTVALTGLPDASGSSISVDTSSPESIDAGSTLPVSITATNRSDEPARLNIHYSLQRDAALYSQPLPDPVFGSNHATGTRSWLVVTGSRSLPQS